jgi:hypothetical protein
VRVLARFARRGAVSLTALVSDRRNYRLPNDGSRHEVQLLSQYSQLLLCAARSDGTVIGSNVSRSAGLSPRIRDAAYILVALFQTDGLATRAVDCLDPDAQSDYSSRH